MHLNPFHYGPYIVRDSQLSCEQHKALLECSFDSRTLTFEKDFAKKTGTRSENDSLNLFFSKFFLICLNIGAWVLEMAFFRNK